MKNALNPLLTALMLLTRLPVGRWCVHSPQAVAASVAFFPLVGALVGLVGAAVLAAGAASLPAKVVVAASMLATVLLTGAIHEDGLCDAADGLFGGQNPARRLEIMKDSRIGSFGAIALWFSLTAKWALLGELLAIGVSTACRATILAHCLSRAASVAMLHLLPHVGTDPTRARPFCERLPTPQLALTLLAPAILGVLLFPHCAAPILASVTLLVFGGARLFERKLGGITGDCLGATVQATELVVLTAACTLR